MYALALQIPRNFALGLGLAMEESSLLLIPGLLAANFILFFVSKYSSALNLWVILQEDKMSAANSAQIGIKMLYGGIFFN